jgi:acetyltransferase
MERYPSRYEAWVTLRDETKVFLRPVKATDGPLLLELFKKLSPSSVYLRFLSPMHNLPENLVYQFTHVDYEKDFGLVALINIGNSTAIIGVGRYASYQEREWPELAVVVRDDWQGKGLGSILLVRVINIGRENGFSRFGATIDPENQIILNIFKRSGYKYKIYHREQGVYYIEIQA